MRSLHTTLLLAVIASPVAHASSSMLRLQCDAASDTLRLSSADAPPQTRADTPPTQEIDVSALVLYRNDEADNPRRTGTRSMLRRCGRYTLRISGGFYNANVLGELGAADDFPVVEVAWNGRTRVGPLRIGTCEEGSPRHGDCARDWAESLEIMRGSAWVPRRSEGHLDTGPDTP